MNGSVCDLCCDLVRMRMRLVAVCVCVRRNSVRRMRRMRRTPHAPSLSTFVIKLSSLPSSQQPSDSKPLLTSP